MHSREQRLRTIVVLVFAVTTAVMLLIFPGRLFNETEKYRTSSIASTETVLISSDENAIVLHRRATAALDALRARESNVR